MAQSSPLQDRVAIVTGSSRGIGREIALHLASLGARIVINYTSNSDLADSVAAEINANSSSSATAPRAVAVLADVSDSVQVKSLFDAAEQSFQSPVHILVNSAGVLDSTCPSLADTSVECFDRTFAVNARGAFLCAREAANRVKRGGGGRIVLLTSSVVASLKLGYSAYAASKAAVETMTKILAKELKGTGITANCVAPGPVATDMFFEGKTEEMVKKTVEECPLGRLGEAKDVAPVVGFLATDAAEWINGQVIRVNGGLSNSVLQEVVVTLSKLTCLVLPREHSTQLQQRPVWSAENSLETRSPVDNTLQLEPIEELSIYIIHLIIDFFLMKCLHI